MKKLLALLLSLALCVGMLAGCNNSDNNSENLPSESGDTADVNAQTMSTLERNRSRSAS